MTNTQIIRFLENEDSSAIQFRRFDSAPKDVYPLFSICFIGAELNWYYDELLFMRSGLSPGIYAKMLKGEEVFKYEYDPSSRLYDKTKVEFTNTSVGNLDEISLTVTNILTGLVYTTETEKDSFEYHSGLMKALPVDRIPLQVEYRTPDTICFTRTSNDTLDTVRIQDQLSFNQSVLEKEKHSDVKIKIWVHYPNQLLRSFHKPVFESTIGEVASKQGGDLITVKIPQQTVVRKRSSSNVPCNKDLVEDDKKLQKQIIDLIKCVPIYWRQGAGANMPYKECDTAAKLQRAFYYIKNYKNIFSTYEPPCVSMVDWSTVSRVEKNQWNQLRIEFLYMATTYKEITNVESFGFESFVSGLGGFVGIFLGYSILQLPELLGSTISFCGRLVEKHMDMQIEK